MGWWNITIQKNAFISDIVLGSIKNDLIKKLEKQVYRVRSYI
jgi:hypothetical protein